MSENLIMYGGEQLPAIENLQKLLNQYPSDTEVQVNKMAKNAKYIPIAVIERLLDELYSGLWQTDNFRTEVIANEVVGSIDLKVYHPVAKMWITRTGAASAMILTSAGKPVTLENKITNTLVTSYPKLKAECIKNAAKSLGVRFGRALNRGELEEFSYLSEQVADLTDGHARASALLETAKLDEATREKIIKRLPRMTVESLNKTITYLEGKQ
jgi:hypothetical protein